MTESQRKDTLYSKTHVIRLEVSNMGQVISEPFCNQRIFLLFFKRSPEYEHPYMNFNEDT